MTISGGMISAFDATNGSTVVVTGGTIGDNSGESFGMNGTTTISGGDWGQYLTVGSGGAMTMSGGSFGDGVQCSSGGSLKVIGADFRLNGTLIPGLSTVGSNLVFNLAAGDLLSGTLADGTPFAFSTAEGESFANNTLTLSRGAIAAGPLVINLPTDPAPLGVHQGQVMIVGESSVVGRNFNAGWGSTVVVSGGTIGNQMEAVGAHVEVRDGAIGSNFQALTGSVIDVYGGVIGPQFEAHAGAVVNVAGGFIDNNFDALTSSVVNISAGSIAGGFEAKYGSVVHVAGGLFQSDFNAMNGSQVHLFGTQFVLDGLDLSNSMQQNVPISITERGVTLDGVLTDGTPFSFNLDTVWGGIPDYFDVGATLTISLALLGDYNVNGIVDAGDYNVWRNTLGQTVANGSGADGNFDGRITDADFGVWKSQFGQALDSSGAANSAVVPEAASILLLGICFPGILMSCRRKRHMARS